MKPSNYLTEKELKVMNVTPRLAAVFGVFVAAAMIALSPE